MSKAPVVSMRQLVAYSFKFPPLRCYLVFPFFIPLFSYLANVDRTTKQLLAHATKTVKNLTVVNLVFYFVFCTMEQNKKKIKKSFKIDHEVLIIFFGKKHSILKLQVDYNYLPDNLIGKKLNKIVSLKSQRM